MEFTYHSLERMNKRGITKEMIELALNYGRVVRDKIIFKKKEIQKTLQKYPTMKSKLLKLLDKGGLVLVCDSGTMITMYKGY